MFDIDKFVNTMIYAVIPLLTVAILFFAGRKRLWAAPVISTVLSGITYLIAIGILGIGPAELFGDPEWRIFFLMAMMFQLVIVFVLTVLARFIAGILRR